jgi:hypothetical protein
MGRQKSQTYLPLSDQTTRLEEDETENDGKGEEAAGVGQSAAEPLLDHDSE